MPSADAVARSIAALLLASVACARPMNLPPPPPAAAAAPVALASASAAPKSAVALNEKACDGGSGLGCNNLAMGYLEGREGLKRDEAHALQLFQRSCDLGLPMGCLNTGYLLHAGENVRHDDVRARGVLTKACDAALLDGCYWLGDVYFAGESEDVPLAFSIFDKACAKGHAKSCASEGLLLEEGRGAAKDVPRAIQLLGGACDKDVHYACTALANLYADGKETAPDHTRARSLYERGCADAYPSGCYAFGVACEAGLVGDDCPAEALVRRACDHGVADACATLATWMEKGGRSP